MSVLTNKINQLSGKFGSISNYQSQALEGFLNESFTEDLNVIDYQSNVSYSLHPLENGCTITTYCDTSLPNSENVNNQSYDVDFTDEDWGSTVITTLDGSQSLRNYVQNLNSSNDMYDLLAALTAKFETTPTMSLGDYKNLCDQYVSDDVLVKDFERMSLLSFGTSVNRASFLNLVSSFFRQAMGVSSGAIEVPDTRVYCMNSLLNLVDIGSLWTLISTAVMFISRIAGAIIAIIGAIISAFTTLLGKAKSLVNPSINMDEDNGVWNAPLFTVTDCDLSSSLGWYCKPDIVTDSVISYKLCGVSIYIFGESWQHANAVCYIDNVIDPKKFGEYLRNKIHLYRTIHEYGEHTGYVYAPILCDTFSNLKLELSETQYYDPFDWYAEKDKYPIISVLATLAFSFLSLMGYNSTDDYYFALPGMKWSSYSSITVWNHTIDFNAYASDPIISIGYAAFSYFLTAIAQQDFEDNYATNLDWDDVEYKVKAHSRTDYLFDVWDSCNRYSSTDNEALGYMRSRQLFAVYCGPNEIDSSSFPDVDNLLHLTSQVYFVSSPIRFDTQSCIIKEKVHNQDIFFNDDMNVSTNLYVVSYQDCYPLRFEFETPKAANSALTKALLTLATLSTVFVASMVAYKVVKFKVTNRFRERAAHTLSDAKSNYESGNITLKQYRKIARNYNWKARLLGLPTYDYMNSWYNIDSTSATDAAADISASLGTASDGSDVDLALSQQPISSMIAGTTSAVENNDSLIRQLIALIRGE